MALDPTFKKHWLKALRSGNFNQTDSYLQVTPTQAASRSSDRFGLPVGHCCLGVGCEVTRELFPKIPVNRALDREQMPTERQLKAWGLTSDEANYLSEMNDNGDSFEAIADWIEANL